VRLCISRDLKKKSSMGVSIDYRVLNGKDLIIGDGLSSPHQ